MPRVVTMLFVLLLIPACSDDGSPGTDGHASTDGGFTLDGQADQQPWETAPDASASDGVMVDGPADAQPTDTGADWLLWPDGAPPWPDGGPPWPDGGGPGTHSCDDVYSCVYYCSSQSCINACIAQGTVVAQQRFSAMMVCLSTADAGTCSSACSNPQSQACQSCLYSACGTEIVACIGGSLPDGGPPPSDGGPPPSDGWPVVGDGGGSATCDQLLQCMYNCTTSACGQACYNTGSPAAQAQYTALANCIDTALYTTCTSACASPSSTTCDTCLNQACSQEIFACFGP